MNRRSCLPFAMLVCLLCAGTSLLAQQTKQDDPETVLATFHVKPDQLPAFLAMMKEYGDTLRSGKYLAPGPYLLLQGDEQGKPLVVQVFTWRSSEIPDHVPASIKPYWDKMNQMVEARNGHPGIEFSEMAFVEPAPTASSASAAVK